MPETPETRLKDDGEVEPSKSQTPDSWQVWTLRGTSVITLLIKLAGIILAINEAFFTKPPHDAVIFAIAAFMMAGATGIDSLVGSILKGIK